MAGLLWFTLPVGRSKGHEIVKSKATNMNADDISLLFNTAAANLCNVVKFRCARPTSDKIDDCVASIQATILYGITRPGTLKAKQAEIRDILCNVQDSTVITALVLFNSAIHATQHFSAAHV